MSNSQNIVYRHTQIGYTSLLISLPVVLAMLYILLFEDPALAVQVFCGVMGIPFLLAALFNYGLMVTVDDDYLFWHFGMGAFKKKIKLEDILSISVVDNTASSGIGVSSGFGARITKRGMLYSVSGSRAVELKIKTAWKKPRVILLGTDQPEILQDVLVRQITAKHKLLGSAVPETITFPEKELLPAERRP